MNTKQSNSWRSSFNKDHFSPHKRQPTDPFASDTEGSFDFCDNINNVPHSYSSYDSDVPATSIKMNTLPVNQQTRGSKKLLAVDTKYDRAYTTATAHSENFSGENTHMSTNIPGTFGNNSNRTKRFSTLPPPTKHHYKSDSSPEDFQIDDNELYEPPVGQEPGVDVDTMFVDLPDSIGSQVTVIDYSKSNCKISHYDVEKDGKGVITGSNHREMVQKHLDNVLHDRPSWCKVRWIVVNGLSWEAIKPIAVYYKLHPLAVEDMLDIPQRTKMEIFEEQLFCCFPLHVLNISKTPYSITHYCVRQILLAFIWIYKVTAMGIKRSYNFFAKKCSSINSENIDDLESNFGVAGPTNSFFGEKSEKQLRFNSDSDISGSSSLSKQSYRESSMTSKDNSYLRNESPGVEECIPFYTMRHGILCGDAYSSPVAEKIRQMPSRSIYDWNQGNHLLRRAALQNMHIPGTPNSYEITHEQVSLFMVGDTVISFFEKSGPEIYGPIENRLKSHDTMLRQSSDPAILVQAILDASVDLLGPILNAYRVRLNLLQVQSLQQPNLQHTRALYAFMTDLTILRPPISSLSNIVSGLWSKFAATRKHKAKCEAILQRGGLEKNNNVSQELGRSFPCDSSETITDKSSMSEDDNINSNLVSDVAALYFGDVADHALRYLEDIDDMRNQSRTLSSLIFNTISIHGSDYMKMLSLVSVVFLPLTFLTGYFGMNFKTFTILDHDVAYYWVIAAPAAAALSAVVMYSSTKYQILEIWARAKAQL